MLTQTQAGKETSNAVNLPVPGLLSGLAAGLVALVLLFRFLPEIDLWFSGLFFDPIEHFYLAENPLIRVSYAVFLDIPYVLVPLLLWMLFASWRWGGRSEAPLRRATVFLLAALVLGPGLVVNEVLKNHSGRARPAQVEQFGGERVFSPAFATASECNRNCSFVSGHAAMGFYFVAFAWAFGERRWLYYGALIGGLVGLGRIMQGAHFLSDVIFSLVAVIGVTALCARWILGRWSPTPG